MMVMWGLALILAATLFPFDFSFEGHINFSNKFGLSRTIESRGNDLIIGTDAVFGPAFRGKISELRIYRNALTPFQIAHEAKRALEVKSKSPVNLVGTSYKRSKMKDVAASNVFFETSGTGRTDELNIGKDGDRVKPPVWIMEDKKSPHVFDGLGQYLRVANSPSVDVSGRNLTISMLIELDDYPTDGVIVAMPWHRGLMAYPYYQYGIQFNGNNAKSVDFYFGDTSGRLRGPFSVKPALGGWTHVAFVYDGSVRGYVDGSEQLEAGIGDPWDFGDIAINLLLFIPLGFGLAAVTQGKGVSPFKAVPFILLLSGVLSFCVEILQCWLPTREPSFTDVLTNSTSAIVGEFFYFTGGYRIFAHFNRVLD
ncbi:MAG: LamG-like jellyroll fold domain-containing protein [Burkholderiales bacterium]